MNGTNDDDNPFADLEKIKREIKMLLLKILLTSVGEDLPQFFFNVEYMRLKDDDNFMLVANSTSPVPTTNSREEDGSYEMLFLLKSAVMVSEAQSIIVAGLVLELCGVAVTSALFARARNRLASPPRRCALFTKNTRR